MDHSTYEIPLTAEGRRRVQACSYILCYSRRQYVRFVAAQDFTTAIREHIRAFELFQGLPAPASTTTWSLFLLFGEGHYFFFKYFSYSGGTANVMVKVNT
jgi:transposase